MEVGVKISWLQSREACYGFTLLGKALFFAVNYVKLLLQISVENALWIARGKGIFKKFFLSYCHSDRTQQSCTKLDLVALLDMNVS